MNQWTHRKIDDKWVVGKWICERIRFDTNGNMYTYHDDPEEELMSETYEFETEWAAESHARFCNRLEKNDGPIFFTNPMRIGGSNFDCSLVQCDNTIVFQVVRPSEKIVVKITHDGKLDYVDVPYIVSVWLKNSALGKLLKKFWYGWK